MRSPGHCLHPFFSGGVRTSMSGDTEAEGALTPPAEGHRERQAGANPRALPRSTDSEPAAPGPPQRCLLPDVGPSPQSLSSFRLRAFVLRVLLVSSCLSGQRLWFGVRCLCGTCEY